MKVTDKDIATIEALHDLLLDNHGYDLNCRALREARELLKRMRESVEQSSRLYQDPRLHTRETIKDLEFTPGDILLGRKFHEIDLGRRLSIDFNLEWWQRGNHCRFIYTEDLEWVPARESQKDDILEHYNWFLSVRSKPQS